MRTTLNLAAPSSARERYALAWAIPITVVGVAVLGALSVVAVKNFKAYRRVHRSVLEVQREEAQVRAQEAALRRELERPQLEATYRQTHFINGVIDRRQFSPTLLVEKVTKLLTGDVRLEGLALSRVNQDRVVRLTLSGNDEEAVMEFLSHLEDSPDFTEVTVVSQGLPQEGEEAELPTVSCTARYVGGPPE